MKIKQIGFIIIFVTILNSCKQQTKTMSESDNPIEKSVRKANDSTSDQDEIQNLIRKMLKWADSEHSIDLLPVTTKQNDSIYSEFDQNKLKQNVDNLTETNLFSNGFVENYKQIILALDIKLNNHDLENQYWYVNDMPPFSFSSDMNPWCLCRDNLNWDLVEVEQIKENEYRWKWGGLNQDFHQSWKDFSYKFKVTKEDSIWKISYLEGFDINEIKSF